MDAIELLTLQHDQVEELFASCEQATGMEKQALFDRIADALAVHSAIEEKHFYPAVKAADTRALLVEFLQEHFEMKQLIAQLLDLGVEAQGFDDRLMELRTIVHRHAKQEEEPQLFQKARLLIDSDQLEALGAQMTETLVTLESEGIPRNQVFEELDAPATL